jgi:hypothetical protein
MPEHQVMQRKRLASVCVWLALSASRAAVAAEPLAEFKSDGCSMFPDGNYYSCCYLHDYAYWPGGTEKEKDDADVALRACVSRLTGKPSLGELMYRGVQANGGPAFPTTYRWGYGWRWPHRTGFAPLTADEQVQAAARTAALCKEFKLNARTGMVTVDAGKEITVAQARQICPGL